MASRDEMARKANEAVKRARISGEQGVTLEEAWLPGKRELLEDTLGDVVPGVSTLTANSKRFLLLTDKALYVFKAKRLGSGVGEQLTRRDLEPGLISIVCGSVVTGGFIELPDGQQFSLPDLRIRVLAHVAGLSSTLYARFALDLARTLGLEERPLACRAGSVKIEHTGKKSVVYDFVLGGGDLENIRRDNLRMLVLVTDRAVHLVPAKDSLEPSGGATLAFPCEPSAIQIEGSRITFPNEVEVGFRFNDDPTALAAAVAGTLDEPAQLGQPVS